MVVLGTVESSVCNINLQYMTKFQLSELYLNSNSKAKPAKYGAIIQIIFPIKQVVFV